MTKSHIAKTYLDAILASLGFFFNVKNIFKLLELQLEEG